MIISSAVSFRSTSELADFQWMHLLLALVVYQYYIVAVYFLKYAFLLVRSGFTIDSTRLLDHTRMTDKFKGNHCSLVACQIVIKEISVGLGSVCYSRRGPQQNHVLFESRSSLFYRSRIPLVVVFMVEKQHPL